MKFKNNNHTKLIIKFMKDNKLQDTTIKTYLNYCMITANMFVHPEASKEDFYKILEEILGKEFLKERRVDKMLALSEIFHYFVVETIEVELIKLDSLDDKSHEFYKYYTSKLNNNYKNYYNYDGTINFKGRNQAYAILQQILVFKEVINFNN